jgi:energy-converting hydrogenase A subunit Q
MNVCPSNAIKYLSRERAYEVYRKNQITDIVNQLLEDESSTLAREAGKINSILNNIAGDISYSHQEDEFQEDVTEEVRERLKALDTELEIEDIGDIIEATAPHREIMVSEDECIGCGSCINQCPVNCIELEIPSPVHVGEDCVYCAQCVETCPFQAITLKEEFFNVEEGRIIFERRKVLGPSSGEVHLDNVTCQRCGVCINKCPVDALSLEDDQVIVDQDKCIFCGECQVICPTRAVTLHKD